ncbi:flagellar basal body-associated FliL family protein [Clostridium omnivorum]|uniref:Flagellar protein FliL n=1 Tax=Clostridium omnivorum TaxID=1604902 RepID=A0ABQ5NAZ3_9CLOT|nr:flagellar basal body-associated FliL family protein [Clostridium sp. E14]GLC32359.1 flagellar basal body-associated protein [Clostridium sp. E14]
MGEKKEKKEKTKGTGDKLKLVIIILLVLVIVGGGSFAAWFIFFNKNTAAANATNTAASTQKVVVSNDPNVTAYEASDYKLELDEFLVNLSDDGGKKYLKVKMILGYNTKEKKKFPAELEEKKPILRDTIIAALRNRKSTDITAKGIEDLKKEIINRVNVNLEYGKINNVFITDIIVQ